jgi:hypothetical protein
MTNENPHLFSIIFCILHKNKTYTERQTHTRTHTHNRKNNNTGLIVVFDSLTSIFSSLTEISS